MKIEVISIVITDNDVRIISPFPANKSMQILKDIISSETVINKEELQ